MAPLIDRTTLASSLKELFQMLAAQAAQPNAATLIRCWREVFKQTEAPGLLEPLGIVEQSLRRLRRQVDESRLLDQEMRAVAIGVVNGLDHLTNPDAFGQNPQQFSSNCTPDRLGTLGMLAATLRLEFSEPRPAAEEIEQIKGDIGQLIKNVEGAGLPTDFRLMLLKRLQLLEWMLGNLNLFGIEAARDSLAGSVMLAAELAPKDQGDQPSMWTDVRERVFKLANRLSRLITVAQRADEGLQAIEHIEKSIRQIGGG